MTLSQLKRGQTAEVVKVAGEGTLRRRMLEMGFVPKTQVTVTGTALFGDPIRLTMRECNLCIRKKDASLVEISGGAYGEDVGPCR